MKSTPIPFTSRASFARRRKLDEQKMDKSAKVKVPRVNGMGSEAQLSMRLSLGGRASSVDTREEGDGVLAQRAVAPVGSTLQA